MIPLMNQNPLHRFQGEETHTGLETIMKTAIRGHLQTHRYNYPKINVRKAQKTTKHRIPDRQSKATNRKYISYSPTHQGYL